MHTATVHHTFGVLDPPRNNFNGHLAIVMCLYVISGFFVVVVVVAIICYVVVYVRSMCVCVCVFYTNRHIFNRHTHTHTIGLCVVGFVVRNDQDDDDDRGR